MNIAPQLICAILTLGGKNGVISAGHAPAPDLSFFGERNCVSFSARYLHELLRRDRFELGWCQHSLAGKPWNSKLAAFCTSPGEKFSWLSQHQGVQPSTTDLRDLVVFEELHYRWSVSVLFVVQAGEHG